MPKPFITVLLAAVFCALLGVVLYRWQGGQAEAMMNPFGVVSFASLGACFGCLIENRAAKT